MLKTRAPSTVLRVPAVTAIGMGDTADVLRIGLSIVVNLVIWVAIPLLVFPGPVQRWSSRLLEDFERLRVASGVRRAAPLLMQMMLLPPRIRDRVDGHGLAPLYVMRWWRALPLATAIKTLQFLLLLFVAANVDDMADWEHLRLSADPGPQPGVVQALLSSIVALPTMVRLWDFGAIGKVPPFLFWALILIVEVRLANRINLTSSGNRGTVAAYDLEYLTGLRDKESARMEYRRCWAVVALLTVAAQCATVLRRWEETQPDCQIPRVSMQPVEHAIWRAHRTRRARARRHNERQFKAHAALVGLR
ncbi:hypothetical protein ACW4TU_41625 [Streptomyces sp. QTS52]